MRLYSGCRFSDTECVSMLELIYPRKPGNIYRTFISCILISVLYFSFTSQSLSSTPKSLSLSYLLLLAYFTHYQLLIASLAIAERQSLTVYIFPRPDSLPPQRQLRQCQRIGSAYQLLAPLSPPLTLLKLSPYLGELQKAFRMKVVLIQRSTVIESIPGL
jgi:hypothetical protein